MVAPTMAAAARVKRDLKSMAQRPESPLREEDAPIKVASSLVGRPQLGQKVPAGSIDS
jgi:hypothetical protein